MKRVKKMFFASMFAVLLMLNIKLTKSLVGANNEFKHLQERINSLTLKKQEAEKKFILKQDHMRKLLSDKNFAKQIVRKKERYIERGETIFKFEN